MDSDVNMNSNVVRLNKWNVMEMMTEETTKMFFNNKCLKRRGALDSKKTLFRLAQIYDKSIKCELNAFVVDPKPSERASSSCPGLLNGMIMR